MWYPEKQPNLKKWFEIKKTQPLAPIAAKLASAGTKLFLIGTCPAIVLVTWAGLDFDWDTLTFDPGHFNL